MSKLRMMERQWCKFELYEEVEFGWQGQDNGWEGIVVGFSRLDGIVHYAIETPEGKQEEDEESVMIVIRIERDVRKRKEV